MNRLRAQFFVDYYDENDDIRLIYHKVMARPNSSSLFLVYLGLPNLSHYTIHSMHCKIAMEEQHTRIDNTE